MTASARALPVFAWDHAEKTLVNVSGTSPETTAVIDAEIDLYGTLSIFTCAARMKSSPARCVPVPAPVCANASWPGLAFAAAISSFTEATDDGCAISMYGCVATSTIGAKSLTGSYGSFLYRLTLTAMAALVLKSSV